MPTEIRRLTRTVLEQNLEQLIVIDSETIGESWAREHFFADLPGKWECSWVALCDMVPSGFVVASDKRDSVHVHRIAVAALARGQGIGRVLLDHVAESAKGLRVERITLRVASHNDGAIRFYKRLGFSADITDAKLLSLGVDTSVLLERIREPGRRSVDS